MTLDALPDSLARLLSVNSITRLLLLLSWLLLLTMPAAALQPLPAFTAAARAASPAAREAEALRAQRDAEATAEWLKLAPTASVRAVLTRNQEEILVPFMNADGSRNAITPLDQQDLTLGVTLPVVSFAQWMNIRAASEAADAAAAQASVSALDVERAVTRSYYAVVAAEALGRSAARARETADKNLELVRQRRAAGFATDLDEKRAEAEVERAGQSEADAAYTQAIARRQLRTQSTLQPEPGAEPLTVSLEAPAALEGYESDALARVPELTQARADQAAAEARAQAALGLLLPTISAQLNERITNAVGFQISPFWSLQAIAEWRFDASAFATRAALSRQAEASGVRLDRAQDSARDRVHSAWQLVVASLLRSRAARAQVDASALAVTLSQQRYQSGTATLLDVITAQRDLLSAEVSQIQADADLIVARRDLELTAGRGDAR